MKTLKNIIIITVFALFTGKAFAQSDTLKIKTSSQCEDCKQRIENKLNFTKGVKSALLDLNTKEVTVIYDKEKTNPDAIRTAITKVGYDADNMHANEKAYKKLPKCCQKGGHDSH